MPTRSGKWSWHHHQLQSWRPDGQTCTAEMPASADSKTKCVANSHAATHQLLRQQWETGEDCHIHLAGWTLSVVAVEKKNQKKNKAPSCSHCTVWRAGLITECEGKFFAQFFFSLFPLLFWLLTLFTQTDPDVFGPWAVCSQNLSGWFQNVDYSIIALMAKLILWYYQYCLCTFVGEGKRCVCVWERETLCVHARAYTCIVRWLCYHIWDGTRKPSPWD